MFLDTSGLLCYLDRHDARHAEAVAHFDRAAVRLTHGYVLAELVALCQARGIDRPLALAFADELADNPLVECVWVDEPLHKAAMALLHDRPDKTYSLCDAVSFIVMRARGLTDALTTDRHFEQEGFVRLLKP